MDIIKIFNGLGYELEITKNKNEVTFVFEDFFFDLKYSFDNEYYNSINKKQVLSIICYEFIEQMSCLESNLKQEIKKLSKTSCHLSNFLGSEDNANKEALKQVLNDIDTLVEVKTNYIYDYQEAIKNLNIFCD